MTACGSHSRRARSLKAARLALVGIADDGFGRAWGLGNGLPLLAGGKARAAPAGKLAVGNEGHQLGRFSGESLLQCLVSTALAVAGQGGAARGADVGKDAFLVPAGIGRGQGRRTRCKGFRVGSDQHLIAFDDRNGIVAAAGARHGRGIGEAGTECIGSAQGAYRAGADARGTLTGRLASEVVVKG